jgi:hypothetical protein
MFNRMMIFREESSTLLENIPHYNGCDQSRLVSDVRVDYIGYNNTQAVEK